MTIRITQVAADLRRALFRRRQELGAASAPFVVDSVDIGDADVQKAAGAIRVRGRLEGNGRLVIRRVPADVDDDPAVRERDERRLAGTYRLAAEYVGVEAT